MSIRRHLVCSHDIPCKCPGGGITKILDELQLPDSRVAREVLQLPPYEWVTWLSSRERGRTDLIPTMSPSGLGRVKTSALVASVE